VRTLAIALLVALAGCNVAPGPGLKGLAAPDGIPFRVVERVNSVDGSKFLLSVGEAANVAAWQVKDPTLGRWGTTFNVKVAGKQHSVGLVASCIGLFQSPEFARPGALGFDVRNRATRFSSMSQEVVNSRIEANNREMQQLSMMVGMMGALSSGIAASNPSALSVATINTNAMSVAVSQMTADQTRADSGAAALAVDQRFWSEGASKRCSDSAPAIPSFRQVRTGQMLGGLVAFEDIGTEASNLLVGVRVFPAGAASRFEWHEFVFLPER
jgi:hypothetical protein